MKKKYVNALLSIVLVLALILSGCSNSNNGGDSDGANNPKTQNTSDNGKKNNDPAPADQKEEREHLTLEWYVAGYFVDNNAVLPSGDEDFVKKAIEEKFDVTLNFTAFKHSADFEKQLNAKLAADPPHLFIPGGVQSSTLATDGLLADMTPFVSPETMPNYFEHWLSQEELDRYAIENSFVRAPVPFTRNRYAAYYIRKDWLDHLGLSIPKTYDEMLDAMRKFTFDDPDGNGKNDTYGMSVSGNGTSVSWEFPQFVNNDLWSMTFDKGKATYRDGGTDLELEKILGEVKAMLDEGIVDPDWFLNKGTAHWDKAAGGTAGIVFGATMDFALDGNPNSIQSRIKAIIPNADFVPFTPFGNEKGLTLSALPGLPFAFHTNVAKEEPEVIKRTVEILDWLAGEEGYLLSNYGVEGKHYTRNGNKITILADEYNKIATWLSMYGFFAPRSEADKVGITVVDPRYTERDLSIIEETRKYPVKDHIGTNVAPPEGHMLGDLRTKMREYQAKIIFDEPDASNWPKYHEELMTTYKGKMTFDAYAEQIGKAHGIDVKFDEGSVDR